METPFKDDSIWHLLAGVSAFSGSTRFYHFILRLGSTQDPGGSFSHGG
jgi:hypothetical protein